MLSSFSIWASALHGLFCLPWFLFLLPFFKKIRFIFVHVLMKQIYNEPNNSCYENNPSCVSYSTEATSFNSSGWFFWIMYFENVLSLLFLDSPLLSTIYQFSTMEDEDLAVFAHCHLICTHTPHFFTLRISTLRTVLGSWVSVYTILNSTHYS